MWDGLLLSNYGQSRGEPLNVNEARRFCIYSVQGKLRTDFFKMQFPDHWPPAASSACFGYFAAHALISTMTPVIYRQQLPRSLESANEFLYTVPDPGSKGISIRRRSLLGLLEKWLIRLHRPGRMYDASVFYYQAASFIRAWILRAIKCCLL